VVTDMVKMDSAIMWLMLNYLWIVALVKIPLLRRGSVFELFELEFRSYHGSLLYAWVKVHNHASHTPLSFALSEICHASQAGLCSLCRKSVTHFLFRFSIILPYIVIFWALRTLCTFTHVYSMSP
jgi:hypothetical protein